MRRKVLVSAYACNPAGNIHLHPGEDLTGWQLVQQLRKYFELWVITHAYNRPEIEKSLAGKSLPGVHFVYVKLPPFLRLLYRVSFGERVYYYFWQIQAWRAAIRYHKRIGFALAHHLTFGNYWMPSFIGAFLPVPFIWGPIGGGQKIPRVFLKEFSLFGKVSEWGRDAAQWVGRNLLISRKICMRRTRLILVCNRETKAMFPEKYWPKILYFPVNGISPEDVASRLPVRQTGKAFRILTAGRLIRLKGFDIAIKASAEFNRKYPASSLEIIGEGPEQDALGRLVQGLGLGGRVRFTPWLSRHDLLKRMRDSHVFLFASFRDGGGAVVVEAMASGLPVVCLNAGGPGFHVRPEWGIRIDPDQPPVVIEKMAKALEQLHSDPGQRRAMGNAGRRRARESYLWSRHGERLRDLYGKIMDEALGAGIE